MFAQAKNLAEKARKISEPEWLITKHLANAKTIYEAAIPVYAARILKLPDPPPTPFFQQVNEHIDRCLKNETECFEVFLRTPKGMVTRQDAIQNSDFIRRLDNEQHEKHEKRSIQFVPVPRKVGATRNQFMKDRV